jgi:hypothetical protein
LKSAGQAARWWKVCVCARSDSRVLLGAATVAACTTTTSHGRHCVPDADQTSARKNLAILKGLHAY